MATKYIILPYDIFALRWPVWVIWGYSWMLDNTTVFTFDQPLYCKALTILQSLPLDSNLKHVVLRLLGFHMEMSFLGSIGHLVAGSGLNELLKIVYASNTVRNMLTGKAVSRAVHDHMMHSTQFLWLMHTMYRYQPKRHQGIQKRRYQMLILRQMMKRSRLCNQILSEINYFTSATELDGRVVTSTLSVEEVCSADLQEMIWSKLNDIVEIMTMQNSRCNAWACWTSWKWFLKLSRQATGDFISKQYTRCFHTLPHLDIHYMLSQHMYMYT